MKMPIYLQDVKLTPKDIARFEAPMANWLTAHEHVRNLEPDEAGLREVKQMILYELTHRRRLHMLQRLRARFNSLRMQYEDRQMLTLANR